MKKKLRKINVSVKSDKFTLAEATQAAVKIKADYLEFIIVPTELKKLEAWQKRHGCKKKVSRIFTYKFTQTGIGAVCEVVCSCGKSIDITDYNLW